MFIVMKRVITYGSYDILHVGHINFLRRARLLGGNLIVGLSTDEFNREKGKQSFMTYSNRKIVLESIKYVNKVIPENNWEQKIDDIKKYHIDIFVIGSDWAGKFDYLEEYCQVIYRERIDGISNTMLQGSIKDQMKIKSLLISG